ncbi:mRNA export protein, putative [Babesia ovata]|uniref:mRNA export protein, putative n=1 Tax=Babesia ovata TaxID=189622 RepID=A0A2H6KGM5_9APIC|nr:mRNA export protein, putative [Babesia ovata]GBE62145.1 mRNA export protein, putative [Babesia ovata]
MVTSESVMLYRQEAPVLASCFSTDSTKFFAGGCSNTVMAYDLVSRNPTGMLVAKHDKPVIGVYWVQKFNAIMTTSWDGKICMWDGRQQQPVWSENIETKIFTSHFRPNIACVAGSNGKIHAWNLDNIQHAKSRVTLDSILKTQVRSLCLFPNVTDKSGIVYTSIGGRAVVSYFMEENRSQNFSFKCHRQDVPGKSTQIYAVNAVDFHNIHGTFVTGGGDGNFTIWDKEHRSRVKTFNNVDSPVVDVKLHSETNMLAYATSYDWYKGFDQDLLMKSRRQIGIMQHTAATPAACCGFPAGAARVGLRLSHTSASRRREPSGDVVFRHLACGLQSEPDDKVALYVLEVALPSEPLKEEIRRYSNCVDYEGFPLPGHPEPMYQCVTKAELDSGIHSLRSHSYDDNCYLAAKQKDGASGAQIPHLHAVFVYKIDGGANEEGDMKPLLEFKDHNDEGYGLAFHKIRPILGSCSEDGLFNVWDLSAGVLTYQFHSLEGLNSVELLEHENQALVASEDGHVLIMDLRQPNVAAKTGKADGAVNSVTNHCINTDIFASGTTNGVVHLWDLRRLDSPLREIQAHKSPIIKLQFNNLCPTLIASAAEDATVRVFDLEASESDEEDEASPSNDDEGDESEPNELLFTHTGHRENVYDFCWGTDGVTETYIASVGDDYGLQLWQMTDDVLDFSDEETS